MFSPRRLQQPYEQNTTLPQVSQGWGAALGVQVKREVLGGPPLSGHTGVGWGEGRRGGSACRR